MWGLTQPVAGAVADRYGTGRVLAAGRCSWPPARSSRLSRRAVAAGLHHRRVAAGGAGMAGLGVLMSAVAAPPARRSAAWRAASSTPAGLRQFAVAPVALLLSGAIGWAGALTALGAMALAVVPLAWALRGKSQPAHAKASGGERVQSTPAASAAGRLGGPELPPPDWGVSSCAAFTSPSSPPTCRAWWPVRVAAGSGGLVAVADRAFSTSRAASPPAGRSAAGG